MALIDSLNRLQRAGAENSRATAKLHEAVRDVADLIERTAPHDAVLPRGYIVREIYSNVGATTLLYHKSGDDENCIDYDGPRYLHGDFSMDMSCDRQNRRLSLQFASDIATGLLDEISAFLEARAEQADAATARLEAAGKRESR